MNKTVGLALVIVSLTACDHAPEPPPPPRPALIMTVGGAGESSSLALIGEVRPRYESNQGFRVSGKIIERKVDIGAMVKKGQILARLDAADANLSAAAAMADVRAAEANYALAEAETERQRQLFAKKFISASALDIREAELKTSAARLAQARSQANVSGNQTRYTSLTADRDGVVTQIHAEPGQVVQAGETVAQIANTQELEVSVAVPESRMAEVKVGTQAAVRLWADRQKIYQGIVREISPIADTATRNFNMRITIKNADAAVKMGMTAGVTFSGQHIAEAQTLLIPAAALTQLNGKKIVWVIDAQNHAQPRAVVAGPYREDGVQVTQGLEAGEKIAIAGVHTLVKGQIVKPVTATASEAGR